MPNERNSAERMRVLELLEQGKVTAAEAAELLRALDDDERPGLRSQDAGREDGRPKWFRVRVTDTTNGRSRANIAIPYGMVRFGIGFTPGNFTFRRRGIGMSMPRQVDELLEALRSGKRGTIFDVTDRADGDRIEIIVE